MGQQTPADLQTEEDANDEGQQLNDPSKANNRNQPREGGLHIEDQDGA